MSRPNLFAFATSELSQDAFVCWLLSWAKPDYQDVTDDGEKALRETAMALLNKMLESKGLVFKSHSLEIRRQYNRIDILVAVDKSTLVLIEDKTHSQDHSDQLERYMKIILPGRERCSHFIMRRHIAHRGVQNSS